MGYHCVNCGAEISMLAEICPKCGVRVYTRSARQTEPVQQTPTVSEKSFVATLLLSLFLGVVGGHNFYVGRAGKGILYLFTFGLFGIGALVDFILILCGEFKDSDGYKIKE